jgi:GNAT superfamily N-acetyltransferase
MPTIRRATLADLETLIAFRFALFRDLGKALDAAGAAALDAAMRAYFAEELPAERFIGWLACDDAGTPIGSGGFVFVRRPPQPSDTSGREGYIMNMYTDPAWRGRGVASLMVRAILDFARVAGVRRVHLHASAQGRSVYERAGFVALAAEMGITLDTEGAS